MDISNGVDRPFINVKFVCLQQGAGREIREAIADPGQEYQEKAWNAVLPLVSKLRRCYEHSLELERVVPRLLSQLVGGRLNPTQHLETQQALVKQLAEILEFVLKFDEFKVCVIHLTVFPLIQFIIHSHFDCVHSLCALFLVD